MASNVSTCLVFMSPLDDSGQISEFAEFMQAWSTTIAEHLDSVASRLEADAVTFIQRLWNRPERRHRT